MVPRMMMQTALTGTPPKLEAGTDQKAHTNNAARYLTVEISIKVLRHDTGASTYEELHRAEVELTVDSK